MAKTLDRIPIAGLNLSEIQAILMNRGIDARYSRRLLYWVYRRRISSFGEINDIPRKALEAIGETFMTGLVSPVIRKFLMTVR